ncbi:hypothetical protein, partial [Thermogutta sp.]|uniref:hypothetical protein n=1 Tax=Thermogutta sp. TaxID=1962930 RepID=UPI0025D7F188
PGSSLWQQEPSTRGTKPTIEEIVWSWGTVLSWLGFGATVAGAKLKCIPPCAESYRQTTPKAH